MTKELFIKNVVEQIRCVKVREDIGRELADHIEDQTEAYEEAGESHEEAVRRAVQEMGDPVAVGVELDRIHRPQTDYQLIGMALVFSVLGYFLLCALNAEGLADYPGVLIRQRVVLLLSLGVMAGVYFLDYTFIGRYAYGCYLFLTIAICCSMAVAVRIGTVSLAFMLMYLYVPAYAGILYRLRRGGYGAVALAAGVLLVTTLFAGVVSLQMMGQIGLMCTILLVLALWKEWFAVNRRRTFLLLGGAFVLLLAAVFVLGVYRDGWESGFKIQRLLGWLWPEKYAGGAGYTYLWLRDTLATARFIGPAGSNPFAEADVLGGPMPYPTEPFILFQVICEYGIRAGLLIVLAYAAVIMRAFRIVRRQHNQFGFMISAACLTVLFMNCAQGVLMNSGYYLISSMQLPFVSQGACTAITYAVLIGLLLSIYRNERIVTDKMAESRGGWKLKINVKLEKR